jgi:anaerobic selenocysteine-containing dehydrogenase
VDRLSGRLPLGSLIYIIALNGPPRSRLAERVESGTSMPVPAENRPLPAEPHDRQRVAYSTCYMCAWRCGIKLTLEGDRIRFIQGNRSAAHTVRLYHGDRTT